MGTSPALSDFRLDLSLLRLVAHALLAALPSALMAGHTPLSLLLYKLHREGGSSGRSPPWSSLILRRPNVPGATPAGHRESLWVSVVDVWLADAALRYVRRRRGLSGPVHAGTSPILVANVITQEV